MSKSAQPPIVEVTWLDAYLHTSGPSRYLPEEFADKDPGTLLQSVGYLVRNDKDCVMLSMERRDSDTSYRDILTLPKGMVKNIRKLK